MKYVISWFERPQGSPIEYENAQKRILEVFGQWKAPANFKIEFFVLRFGEWGGHMLVDCDDPRTIHKFCSMLPAFVYSRRDPSLRSRKPSAANSRSLPGGMDWNESDGSHR
jgi:muconolactone delta-isomerase